MADFTTLKKRVLQDWRAQSEWREAAREDFAFLAGHQWTDTEKAALEEKGRAAVVFNRVAVIISSVSGSEINNRTEVRFLPRTMGDVKPNEVLSAGAEWFRDQADAEDEESQAFEDALICGLGWTETALNFEEDPEGEPEVVRIDPLEMAWDCHAHRKGLQDAQRVHRVREIPREEARDMFPGAEDRDLNASWIGRHDEDEDEPHLNVPGDQYAAEAGEAEGDDARDTVTIVQTQWCERERAVEYVLNGQRLEMPAAAWDRISKRIATGTLPHRRVSRKVWRQAFLGNRILKESQPDPKDSTFQAITGHYDRKLKRFYGLLRSMKDPQKYANKWLSQTLHIVNANAKGGVMYEAGAVDDARRFEEDWAASDAAQMVRDGALSQGRIQEKPKAELPAAFMGLTEFAISSIRDASGVNLELLGLRDANQPGVLEYQRRQSAMTTLAGFFDALRFYRKRQGRVILHFLREHIAPTGRLVRVVEDDQARYIPLALADDTEDYDVIVDDAPQAPNQKERNWEIIQAIIPAFADKLGPEDWAMVAKYSPLPSEFAERLEERAKEAREQGPSPMEQLEMAKGQAEIEEKKAQASENRAEAQLDLLRAAQIAQDIQMAPIREFADQSRQQAETALKMRQPAASPA